MTDCDPNEAKAYYNSLYKDSIDCFDPDIEIKKIGASDGQFVTKEMLERYGATSVVFKKYENGIYVLEFEPFKTSQENEA